MTQTPHSSPVHVVILTLKWCDVINVTCFADEVLGIHDAFFFWKSEFLY